MEFDAEPEFRLPSYHSLVVKVLLPSSGRHYSIPPPACQGAKKPVREHRCMFAPEPIQLFDLPANCLADETTLTGLPDYTRAPYPCQADLHQT
jgi:hypothetical protein